MELLFILGLLFVAAGGSWKAADPGGSYSATSAATRAGVRTGGRSAKATWDRRRPDRAKKHAARRKRWARAGLLGWAAVGLERLLIGTSRLAWDGGAATANAVRDGRKAAREEWRTTWKTHHPDPAETGPRTGPEASAEGGPASGPDRSADQAAGQPEPDAGPAVVPAPSGGRVPIREPKRERPRRAREPALVGAGASIGSAALGAAAAAGANPRVDHTPARGPRCSNCGTTLPYDLNRARYQGWHLRDVDDPAALWCADCLRNQPADPAPGPGSPDEPLNPGPSTADGTTDGAPAPDGTTTSTEGRTPMSLSNIVNRGRNGTPGAGGVVGWRPVGAAAATRPAGGGGEVDDLATLQRIAAQVIQQHEDSEFMKIIRMCQTLPESTDFGDRVGKVLAEFAQLCVSLGKVGDEVAEMAPGVAQIAEHVRGEA